MPSRRAALGALASSGSLALASSAFALAGCGVSRKIAHLARHAQACVDVPVPPASGVRVVHGTFPSAHVRDPVGFAVVVPDGAPPGAVAYVLPGRGSDVAAALGLGLDGFLAEYLRGGGRRFALALVDAGESYFHPRASGGASAASLIAFVGVRL